LKVKLQPADHIRISLLRTLNPSAIFNAADLRQSF